MTDTEKLAKALDELGKAQLMIVACCGTLGRLIDMRLGHLVGANEKRDDLRAFALHIGDLIQELRK
jgi:hypothetical protein